MSGASWIGKDLPAIYRDGVEYFIVGYQDGLYLIPNRCPHRGGALKFGFVNADDAIVCPLHQGAFPLASLIRHPCAIRLDERLDATR